LGETIRKGDNPGERFSTNISSFPSVPQSLPSWIRTGDYIPRSGHANYKTAVFESLHAHRKSIALRSVPPEKKSSENSAPEKIPVFTSFRAGFQSNAWPCPVRRDATVTSTSYD